MLFSVSGTLWSFSTSTVTLGKISSKYYKVTSSYIPCAPTISTRWLCSSTMTFINSWMTLVWTPILSLVSQMLPGTLLFLSGVRAMPSKSSMMERFHPCLWDPKALPNHPENLPPLLPEREQSHLLSKSRDTELRSQLCQNILSNGLQEKLSHQ